MHCGASTCLGATILLVVAAIGSTAAWQDGAARLVSPRILPGTPASAFASIQGTALDATNGTMPNSPVRLRDARSGRIVVAQRTDTSGLFAFSQLDPGSYVVELLGDGPTVLAASELLNVNGGESVSAVVKLPYKISPMAALLGHTTSSAAAVAISAAATGVLAISSTADASPDATNIR
jgi:hypothetical protein